MAASIPYGTNSTAGMGTTATVAQGSTTVNFVGTSLQTFGLQPGDMLWRNGPSVRIATIPSQTQVVLAYGWPGTSGSAVAYEIRRTPDASRLMDGVESLIAQLGAGKLYNLGGVTGAADKLPYMTGAETWGTVAFTSFIRTLMDDADQATALATLGALPKAGGTLTGDITISRTGDTAKGAIKFGDGLKSLTFDGTAFVLTGGTVNQLNLAAGGVAAPSLNSRSAGTKITLSPTVDASNVDYALGIESPPYGSLWRKPRRHTALNGTVAPPS